MKYLNHLFIVTATLLLSACGTGKIAYLQDAEKLPASVLNKVNQPNEQTASPGDLIQITVTSRNPESVAPYNKNSYIKEATSSTTDKNLEYYLVDNDGNIEFPVIGTLYISGMTKNQIKDLIISKLYPNHLAEMPAVEIRFKNFRITLLGEVNKPGIINVENEKITILEAIAEAGDLTINGERDNIMLIRTQADGSRSIHTININDKNILTSQHFNLQRNDIIYVQPNASKKRSSWSVPPGLTLAMSSIGTLISIATLIITISKL